MADNGSRHGRVFCITGYSATGNRSASLSSSRSSTSSSRSVTCHSDNDSSTSGYLSSSFESSSEERRLVPSEEKVFRLWERLDRRKKGENGPRNSTPKRNEDKTSRLPSISLVLKGSFADSSQRTNSDSDMVKDKTFDSFWDIETPQMFKCRSENDVRLQNRSYVSEKEQSSRRPSDYCVPGTPRSSTNHTESGYRSTNWKRKPYLTHSNSSSDIDLRLSGGSESSHGTNTSDYQALPRYRVKMDDHGEELARKFTQSCADIVDVGLPVDESMGEFIAKVDKTNLAGLLEFYDRVTNTTEYERARRNPRNYEAVYY